MLNRVVLVGRLTRDPELRYTPNGVAVANFTLAVNRPFSNQQGDREADFINCVIWRKQAENVANYLKKGSLAGVDGRVQTRSYDNNEGRRVFITEIVAESVQFLEPRGSNQGGNQGQNDFYGGAPAGGGGNDFARQGNQQQPNRQSNSFNDDPFANDGKPIDISDDDLPF
ncbi:single-stranded DNA-binding protein [Alkalihalobacillus pseudalcaliphilus]|uniref:single-stranded DNA-binding protein n=1 Tax=Alkalihalobacillus pseudalcaliphilus TaxID=79884 RepID=UPI00064E0061|nr:single-stranded DNA-binding protein [Alkalihalobacillus pseudalcaliphilus]KMK77911.1 single-stranded DNA-binding protein [Alkalihalobacillus pseudalcaliphilus]